MNGYTTVLTAVYPVICGETYHIKLAIGDGTDTILDSVVILEEGSLVADSDHVRVASGSGVRPRSQRRQIIYCAWEDCRHHTISRPCACRRSFRSHSI